MKVAKVADAAVLEYERTDVKAIEGGGGRGYALLENADITKLHPTAGEPLHRYA